MATPKKQKNGKWRVRVYSHTENGKKIYASFTADTKIEAEVLATSFKVEREQKPLTQMTVGDAIDKYIKDECVFLSPTTIANYKVYREHGFPDLMDVPVTKLNEDLLNLAIRNESRRINERTGKVISAKTVKNEWGLIATALKSICKRSYTVKLPKIQHKNVILPTPQDVYAVVKGTEIELPCLLAMWLSFTSSEIFGLRCSSIKGDIITIDQVTVQIGSEQITKSHAKTDTRIRVQSLPDYILDLIKKEPNYIAYLKDKVDRPLLDYNRDHLNNQFKNIVKKHFDISFHSLRHIFATTCSQLGIDDKIICESGGWKTDHVMKSVYKNMFTDSRQKADEIRDNFYNEIIVVT